MNPIVTRAAAAAATAALLVGFAAPAAFALPRTRLPLDPPIIVEDPADDPGDPGTGGTGGQTGTGKYRVTLERFRVNRQTYDHALQVDGKGDEVFVAYKNVVLNAAGDVIVQGEDTSAQMGDRNGFPARVKAGTLSADGGLRSTDVHDARLRLWEGPLDGGQTTVISPTIWEWDGGGDAFAEWSGWAASLPSRIRSAASELGGPVADTVITLADIGLGAIATMPVGTAGDKPIGSVDSSSGTTFEPQLLTLDQERADYIIENSPFGEPGIVAMRYAGSADHGDYTLYLRIERV